VTEDVIIDRRFRGPPVSANGGYTCGLLARFVEGPAEVTLRAPPPLSQTLHIERRDGDVVLLDGSAVIAEARPGIVELDVPEPVSVMTRELRPPAIRGGRAIPTRPALSAGHSGRPGTGSGSSPGRSTIARSMRRRGFPSDRLQRPTVSYAMSSSGLRLTVQAAS
jgi:hypothetical protein